MAPAEILIGIRFPFTAMVFASASSMKAKMLWSSVLDTLSKTSQISHRTGGRHNRYCVPCVKGFVPLCSESYLQKLPIHDIDMAELIQPDL